MSTYQHENIHEILSSFPDNIQHILSEERWEENHEGMTDAQVFLSQHYVIKRMPHDGEAQHEMENYQHFSNLDLIPRLIFSWCNDDTVILLTKRLNGCMLSMHHTNLYLPILKKVFTTLWSIQHDEKMIDQSLTNRLKQAEFHVTHGMVDMESWDDDIQKGRFKTPSDLLHYLKAHQPKEDLVFSHGDLTFENMIVDSDHQVGLIDLGRMGYADRYQDLALAYRSLLYETGDQKLAKDLFQHLNLDLDEEKLDYYLLLDELF